MKGKTHAAIGTALTLPFVDISNPMTYLYIPAVLYGALVPDIDADYSLIQSSKYTVFFILIAFILLLTSKSNISFISVIVLIALTFYMSKMEHRTIMHSLAGMFIFVIPVFLIKSSMLPAFLIGYGTHLLTDSLTLSGIPLLYPNDRIFGLRKVPYDGMIDRVLRDISILLIAAMIYGKFK